MRQNRAVMSGRLDRVDAESVTETAPDVRLISDADEAAHLVCCRAPVWRFGFCGAESDEINMAAEHVCSMCVEEIHRLMPDFDLHDPPLCPIDRAPCPTQLEVDLRVLRETSPRE